MNPMMRMAILAKWADDIRFRTALDWLWPVEGGWYDGSHARDPHPTNFGITQTTFDAWRAFLKEPKAPVRSLTQEEAGRIYWHWYWLKPGCRDLTWPLALVHFDAAVNHGTGLATKLLRRAEGNWRRYIAARRDLYAEIIRNRPAMKANERGWENRMRKLERFCEEQE